MNKPDFNQIKNTLLFKIVIGAFILLLIIKTGKAGYEFDQWLKAY